MAHHKTPIPVNQEINDEHRKAIMDFKKKHGRFPGIKDPEFWQASEVYKKRYQEIIDREDLIQAKLDKQAEKDDVNPVFSKTKVVTEKICAQDNCEEIVKPTGKRGRPPTKCKKHRAKPKDKVVVGEFIEM